MLLEIKSRSKSIKPLSTDELVPTDFVNDLIDLIATDNGLKKNRIRLTYERNDEKVPLQINKTFKQFGITGDATLNVKDLGPQVGWRNVYLIEYAGPIILHSLFFYGLHSYFNEYANTYTQIALYDISLLHFLKRVFETLFVHKFSNATMPFRNIFKNSFHYWILNGVLCSLFVYAPVNLKYSKNPVIKFLFHTNDWGLDYVILFGLIIGALEVANYITHANLSSIRDKNPKNYEIPYGFGFDYVTCPNYFFEIMAFLTFAILSGNWSYFLFIFIGGVQMYIWAVAKHKKLLKTFGDDYKKLNRKVLIPFIL